MGIEMAKIKIGDRLIGDGQTPIIVAEAGINHNGEVDQALEMIRVARDTGADAIKFQTFRAVDFVSDPGLKYTYRSQGKEITESMLDMFQRYEFSKKEWRKIKESCDKENIIFLSTPQNRSDLDLLLELGIAAVKVGSDDLINLPLLKNYSETKLPLILSCGMADLSEVYHTLDTVGAFSGYPVALLLCTSEYPTPPEDVNLLKLKTLRNAFPMIVPGFSDHTQGTLASSIAVGLGASLFEKHFTLSHDLPGPDHWFSLDKEGLKEWVDSIKTSFNLMGSGIVKPTSKEQEMRILARRSIVAGSDIKKGDPFTFQNILLKRPGDGLSPTLYEEIIGLRATKDLKKGSKLKHGDFE